MTNRQIGHADFHVLLALLDTERHGYGIIKEVEQMSEGRVAMGPGTLYGSIKRLLQSGQIEETAERPTGQADDGRRSSYYRLTPQGRKAVEAESQRIEGLLRIAADKTGGSTATA